MNAPLDQETLRGLLTGRRWSFTRVEARLLPREPTRGRPVPMAKVETRTEKESREQAAKMRAAAKTLKAADKLGRLSIFIEEMERCARRIEAAED